MSERKNYVNLADYIKHETAANLYLGVPERFDLIRELINAYNDWFQSSADANAWKYTPCFSLENITLQAIPCEDERVTWQHYQIQFPQVNTFDVQAQFANESNVPARLLGFDDDGQRTCPTIMDACRKCEKADVVGVLTRLMFQILFGCHPFLGRDYYAQITMSDDETYEFFSADPHMIFDDIVGNSNRFINSYHDREWLLWNRLNKEQKDFWLQAFGGDFINVEELRDGWLSAYTYLISNVIAPCGQAFNTLVFNNKSTLIVSDNAIANQQIYCRGCFNARREQCRDCQHPERIAKFQQLLVRLERREVVPRDDDVEEIHSLSKKFLIYDGLVIKGSDFPDLNDPDDMFMVVASTKKVNLIGLKNLRETPITLTQNGVAKNFPQNSIVPLLPGVIVPIGNHYHVVMAGDTPKEPVPDKPEEPTPTQPTNPQPTPLQPVQPKPVQPVNPQPIQPKPQPATEPPKPQPTQPVQQPVQETKTSIEDDQVILENGRVFDVSMVGVVQRQEYSLYTVTDASTGERMQLKIFTHPMTDDQKSIIRQNIKNGLPSSIFVLPLGLIQDAGFAKGKTGYVTPCIPSDMVCLKIVSNLKPSVTKRVMLLIVEAIKALHDAGLCYKCFNIENIYLNKRTGDVLITNNDYISPIGTVVKKGYARYRNPEVALGVCENDQIADCYSMAIILFILCMGVHPMDGQTANSRIDREEMATLYRDDPVFIFHPDRRNAYFERVLRDRERNNLRKEYISLEREVKELFDLTFTCGMVQCVQDIPAVDVKEEIRRMASDRVGRPDANTWYYVIQKWARDGY